MSTVKIEINIAGESIETVRELTQFDDVAGTWGVRHRKDILATLDSLRDWVAAGWGLEQRGPA